MKKILVVFGTRPEAIKMAPVIKELENNFNVVVCVTAQHREMLDQVLNLFDIKPNYDLDLMKAKQDLFDLTSSVLLEIKNVLIKEQPDIVLVHGDTTTTMTTSIACFYLKIPIGHIEAGLRTYNLLSPFPEELNRQIASKCSQWHFAPTLRNKENLIKEGIKDKNIIITGNTVIDSLFFIKEKLENDESFLNKALEAIPENLKIDIFKNKYILITGHRRENFGNGFKQICYAIKDLSRKYQDIHFVYPVHLNPNVREPVSIILSDIRNVHLIEPLGYNAFILLLMESYLILTDSGGIQEEAPSLGKPVIVMREVTERPEALELGTVVLSGIDKKAIVSKTSELIDSKNLYNKMAYSHNPYGDGNSSSIISKFLLKTL